MSSIGTGLVFKGLSAGAWVRIGSPLGAGRRPSSSQRQGLASMMLIQSERDDHKGVPQQVHVLPGMAHALRSPVGDAGPQPPTDRTRSAAAHTHTLAITDTSQSRTSVTRN